MAEGRGVEQQQNASAARLTLRRRYLIALLGGAIVGIPIAGRAQQKAMQAIGFLHFGSSGTFEYQTAVFRKALSTAGFIEGKNVAIEYRWAEGVIDHLPALAADLVGRQVDVILALGPPCARAAKNATSTIPIVLIVGSDPVKEELVTNLPRPEGNLTGISILAVDMTPKRFELISEMVPQATLIALLVNPSNAYTERMTEAVREAARTRQVQLQIVNASNESEIDAAFATIVRGHAGALVIGDDVYFTSRRGQLVALASRYRVPTIDRWREFAAAGGLISYGPSLAAALREAADYVGRILKGAKPTDLPVQQSATFELVVNLKTAKGLGLTVPQSLLARADEVIE